MGSGEGSIMGKILSLYRSLNTPRGIQSRRVRWARLVAIMEEGRLNQTRFLINRPGLFYGQCSEICGANRR